MTEIIPDSEWTPEKERRLIELWYGPLTTEAIGLALGTTKNAVIGKARRLGLGGRIQSYRDRIAALQEPAPAKPLFQLADLGPGDCRWPEGDPREPGFGFCGEPVVPERSYCPDHCAKAYRSAGRDPDAGEPTYLTSVDRWAR